MIRMPGTTDRLSFRKFTTKIACQHKQNTQHFKYLYIANNVRDKREQNTLDLVPAFFKNCKTGKYNFSPYNPAIRKLYRIDNILLVGKEGNKNC